MTKTEIFISGTKINLGKRVGRGGEGEVFALQKSEQLAVKVYTLANLGDREEKIKAMVAADLLKVTGGAIAFPISVASLANGSFAGFIMPLVSKHRPIFELYSPAPRKRYFPNADFRLLIRAALNVTRAIDAVHQAGCVIGDINHSGILVSENGTAVLIDADSFQFSHNGKVFLCKVGVPEFTPPELQGMNLGTVTRTKNHDAFALAVLIFQLLFMGRHPFAGALSNGEMPLEKAIAEYRFAYSTQRQTGLAVPPGTATLADVPPEIASLFERAFSKNVERPKTREWIDALKRMETSLVRCSANEAHYFSRHAGKCTWCRIESQSGVDLFPSKNGPAQARLGQEETAVFARALRVDLPPLDVLPTDLANFSPHNVTLNNQTSRDSLAAIALVAAAVVLFFAVPQLWPASLVMLGVAAFIKGRGNSALTQFDLNLKSIDSRLADEVLKWRLDAKLVEAHTLKADLVQIKREFDNLPALQAQTTQKLRQTRQERLLLAHLDKHFLQHAGIYGIGPTKLRILSSYGFDTAGDLKRRSVIAVPGIGPTHAKNLNDWADGIARAFVPTFSQADEASEKNIIEREIKRIASELIQEAAQKERHLSALANTVQQSLKHTPASLAALTEERRATAGQIQARGGAVPQFAVSAVQIPTAPRIPKAPTLPTISPPSPPNPGTLRPQPTAHNPPSPNAHAPIPTPTVSIPNCPSCGQRMVRRVAKRGRRRGQPFWGCSQYPRCTGIRNI
jgi:DNA-binding helix-hairpin-helix protein with protein kinase domain